MIAVNTNSLKHLTLNEALRFIFNKLNCRLIELTTDSRVHGYTFIFDFEKISLFDYPIRYICLSGGWADFVVGDLSSLHSQFRLCDRMGVNKIRLFVTHPNRPANTSDEAFLFAVKNIWEIADKNPLHTLMFENHGGLTEDGTLTKRLLDTVNRSNVRTVYDAANYIKSDADPIDALMKVLPYVEHIHVKDIKKDGHFCSVGEGITPWQRILEILSKQNYNKAFSIEYEGEGDRYMGLETSYNNFRSMYSRYYND